MNSHQIQIGLEQIASINNFTSIIQPKQLICSICYCININVKQCNNKQCYKLFCDKCYHELISKGDDSLCPYCRTNLSISNPNNTLMNIISSLKYFCTEHITCNKQYTYNEYISLHIHSPQSKYKCFICEAIDLHWKQISKCILCLNYCCDNINSKCIDKCSNCYNPICKSCRKGNEGSFLCGFCSITCVNCLNCEAEVICNLCNKPLCMKCSSDMCFSCNRYYCKNLKCHYKKERNFCNKCSNISQYQTYDNCVHMQIMECKKCYNKCKVCTNIIINNNIKNCKECNINICACSCSLRCRSCLEYICYSCSVKCLICKKASCITCMRVCNECGMLNTAWCSCKKCNSDTLRYCSFESCKKLLCLNCWNICNTCNEIYCKEHSTKCDKCEDTICNAHCFSCKQCKSSKEENVIQYKTCLKKCTYKCNFCPNRMNALCRIDIHEGFQNKVGIQDCQHFVCNKCQIKCAKCLTIVQTCPKCINNYYYSSCCYCRNYLCQNCSAICEKCENSYCSLKHICHNCNKQIDFSLFCIKCFDIFRTKCFICKNKIKKQCETCSFIFLCSFYCYYQYKRSIYSIQQEENNYNNNYNNQIKPFCSKGICEMFFCDKHFWLDDKLPEKLRKIDLCFSINRNDL